MLRASRVKTHVYVAVVHTCGAQCLIFSIDARGLESVPTSSRQQKLFVSPLSPERGFVLLWLTSFAIIVPRNIVILKQPSHRRLVMVLAGVIYATGSEIGIEGDTIFTNNWADYGGENKRGTWIAMKTVVRTATVVLACRITLF